MAQAFSAGAAGAGGSHLCLASVSPPALNNRPCLTSVSPPAVSISDVPQFLFLFGWGEEAGNYTKYGPDQGHSVGKEEPDSSKEPAESPNHKRELKIDEEAWKRNI